MPELAPAAPYRAAPGALPQTAPSLLPAVVSSSRQVGIEPVLESGKTPLHSARFAPAPLPHSATSPRPALCAHSSAKLAAISTPRQDVVQISLTIDLVERCRISLVVAHQILCAD